jgi:hypothetical protein
MLATQVETLHDIGLRHGTDKATCHGYTHRYAPLFEPIRNDRVALLELGYFEGASARMWADYFPNGRIHCIDINPDTAAPEHDRVALFVGDQADPRVIRNAHVSATTEFDIVIDDASHLSSKTIASFRAIWPLVKPGGYYAVEDTHGAYHSHYYGEHEANENPDALTSTGQLTTMQFLRRMADDANYHGQHALDLFPERYWRGYSVDSVTFSFNLAIVRKAL